MSQEAEKQLSIEEAVQRLKWEIIAQDWSLSIKRISLLEEAFVFLKNYYANRKAAHSILIMADSLLRYIKEKGDNIPSESIDFLKEAMAHIVNIYETEDLEAEKEEQIFKIIYYRFNKLKEKIKSTKSAKRTVDFQSDLSPEKESLEIKADEGPFNPEQIEKIKDKIYSLQTKAPSVGEESSFTAQDMENFITSLQLTLDKAESLTTKIKQTIAELRDLENEQDLPQSDSNSVKNCPPTELREIIIEGHPVYLQESAISKISRISSSKLKKILEARFIPAKDLAIPFKRLPKQFKGILGSLDSEELKGISLPVVVPQDPDLPDHPDAEGNKAIIVSKGNLVGVLLCSEVSKGKKNMVKYRMNNDSDKTCTGYTEQGDPLRVINISSVLEEGGKAVF